MRAAARRLVQRIVNAWHRPVLERRLAEHCPPALPSVAACMARLEQVEIELHAQIRERPIARPLAHALADYRGGVAAVITAFRRDARSGSLTALAAEAAAATTGADGRRPISTERALGNLNRAWERLHRATHRSVPPGELDSCQRTHRNALIDYAAACAREFGE